MSKNQEAIKADFYPLEKITDHDVKAMHDVFIKYYHNADYQTFIRDLKRKMGAILVRKVHDGSIVGFTTIALISKTINSKKCLGLFSGDTVMEKAYWGSTKLQTAFIRFMLKTRFKNPTVNFYWFLISKGYKTYLLMANNWLFYYPRHDKPEDEKRKAILMAFSNHLFKGSYDERTGLLKFGDDYQRLKEDVADITDEMKRKSPKIAFFEQINPTWRQGTELPCIGDIDWFSLIWRPIPFGLRKLKNAIFGNPVKAAAPKIKVHHAANQTSSDARKVINPLPER